ncbi:hypothetical protein [Runella slithyformis]|uniref:AlgX/AlgJ SGNH hydrolase-like domain-containing protein n=1 Tax=Runella slithyformis (strain ATCC 29530 / DSM 19594 / LMG 11500 / NCIMB 11436 / LSU 4) TaxID=761193 RepID=A0A7U3ZN69_RUNSL|nr:hypothetical protein [Runella slithyformis]AEI50316.1 hypothetical protein Runsl_3963 [Runella slithyformis DSM 19594]
MKKIISCFCLVFFSLVWVIGCHPTLSRAVLALGLTQDSYRYGDLYRLSNLAQFRQRPEICPKPNLANKPKNNIALYIIGDSFTEKQRINQNDFPVQTYLRTHWSDSIEVPLDTTKRNILILETVERHFREHFAVPVRTLKINTATPQTEQTIGEADSKSWDRILKDSEEALSDFLFSNDFFLRLKEWKAALNLNWFGRHSDQIALSPDGKNILFCWDTDSTRITSSFHPLPDRELIKLIQGVNAARDYYRSLGFDEVYVTIIPNKTTIVAREMGTYNHLVERVQSHPALRTPIIDVWSLFNQHSTQVYALSDTHWSCFGQRIWVDKVNSVLK